MKVSIKITGEGTFAITTDGRPIEYIFVSHGEKCSVFAVPINHALAVTTCPICGQEFSVRGIQ